MKGLSGREGEMERLLVRIGELVCTELEDVEDVNYLKKDMGHMFVITDRGGKKVLLSLLDIENEPDKKT